ncbi:hypothetical protein M413DRAFT_447304 [Hebeloma cylindrosporum]|uniref:Uncharacterized protein n=1 Tax=Hebeloma cylindrosporum TaxID=76867 RepID=A0A0C3C6Z0_HEBCY|nr:hypothetical protein M413DRAFT_447304 [Hebeloma cylindrosporum h7]
MKELTYAQPFGDSPPTTPTNGRHRKARRNKSRRNCKGLTVSTQDPPIRGHRRPLEMNELEIPYQNELVYHPGHLEEEVYEFLSRTPEEVAFKVVRTITMWSCCDEDEWSPGCVVAPSYGVSLADHERDQQGMGEFAHSDVFPDSDLEQTYERVLQDPFARSPHSA